MIWLGIVLIGICTIIFAICGKRLYHRRYCQKTFLHCFALLRMSYITCYIEAISGIVIACFICLNYDDPPIHILNYNTLFLMGVSADCFIIRILRQYRIYLLTYIEKGLFNYNKLIKRKCRLTVV